MEITDVVETCERRRFEFTAWRGGPFEVYDYPRTWGGVARFVGHLPATTGEQLVDVLLHRGRGRISSHAGDGYFAARLLRRAA